MRNRIFDLIFYLDILRMYTIVHIFLAYFSITATIKFRIQSFIAASNRSSSNIYALSRSNNNKTIAMSSLPPSSLLILLLPDDSVTFTKYVHHPLNPQQSFLKMSSEHIQQQNRSIKQKQQQHNQFRVLFTTLFILGDVIAQTIHTLPQIFTLSPASKTIISISGLGFSSVLLRL